MSYLRYLLIVLAALVLVFCFVLWKALWTDCRWYDLDRTTARSGEYLAMVRLQDCWDHQNFAIRIERQNKWTMDLDIENETDHNEDEPIIKWAAPLTLEVAVRTATLKGTIERQINAYDGPNSPKITVTRQYIPR